MIETLLSIHGVWLLSNEGLTSVTPAPVLSNLNLCSIAGDQRVKCCHGANMEEFHSNTYQFYQICENSKSIGLYNFTNLLKKNYS